MFVDRLALWVIEKIASLGEDIEVLDYGIGLRYSYVVVKGSRGCALGLAITPIEDIVGTKAVHASIPRIDMLKTVVSSTNPLDKTLGIALLNALSSYLLWLAGVRSNVKLREDSIFETVVGIAEEPIVVVGNMVPLVDKLRKHGFKSIVVLERNPCMRCGLALSDAYAPRVIPYAKTIIVTGATLVNDTIDYIIELSRRDSKIVVVGPTAGIHPEPALEYGIYAIASLKPIDIDAVVKIVKLGGGRWDYTKFCREYIAMRS